MGTWNALLLVAIVFVLTWFVYSLIWGKPWTIKLLFARTFLRLAFSGPELLTHVGILEKFGIHFHNGRLSDASVAYETKTLNLMKRDLKILRSYDQKRMSKETRLSRDIMEWFLDDQARSERFRFHSYPLNQMFGVQSELPNFMMTIHPLNSKVEARNYIKRLSQFGRKFDQVLEGVNVRTEKGIIPPRFVIQRVLDEMTAFVGQPARQNPLYSVFADKTQGLALTEAERGELLSMVEAEIERTVYPAYQRMIEAFRDLEAKATDDDGMWKLPDGEAYYEYSLRSSTTSEMTPEQVHTVGLAEVERIEAEMMSKLRSIFANPDDPRLVAFRRQTPDYEQMSPTRILQALGKQPFMVYPNTDEGRQNALAEYQRILDESDARMDEVFELRPKAKLKVERVPEFREKTSAGAYYQIPDLGGSRPGVFYANLRDMSEVRKFAMKTLAYHEGIPGHHWQLAIAQQLKGLPIFRRLLPFTAYAEGWALYAERLASEMGFYENDAFGELGCLDAELFRAVRLVVDTGIHFKRWTRQQAIDYMDAHCAQAHEATVSEVERYIVMPGQACAYKIGMLKMLELREKRREALGDRFELRKFHSLILQDGSMPLEILEEVVEGSN
jgi:uncharacterized protein (DUF885 family)